LSNLLRRDEVRLTVVMKSRNAKNGSAASAFDRDDQRNRKRDAVLRAAASAFNRRGYANTSLDDIAASLGVSKPTLYQYFSSKQEILYRCHQRALDQGDAGVAQAEMHRGNGLDKLFVYMQTYMRGFFGEFGAGPVLTDVDSLSPANRKKVVERRSRISAATTRFIAEGVKDGSIVDCDPKLANLFALSVVNWMAYWYREDGPNTPEEIMSTFTMLVRSGLTRK
jgi:TetR/AcrR family transcriptional regulator